MFFFFVDRKFKFLAKLLKEINSKVDVIVRKVDFKIDFNVKTPTSVEELTEISNRSESDRMYAHSVVRQIFVHQYYMQ